MIAGNSKTRYFLATYVRQIGCLILIFLLPASQDCFAAGTAVGDPFAYCAAIRNIDTPPGGASPIPAALQPYIASALRLPPDSTIASAGYYWRCMGGSVYVCAMGANIPCDAKADLAKRNLGAEQYCRENRDVPVVPAYATGHATIYSWSCTAGKAILGRRAAKVDRRGFRVDFWYRVNP